MEYVISAFAGIGVLFLLLAAGYAAYQACLFLKQVKRIPEIRERIEAIDQKLWDNSGRLAVLEGTRQVVSVRNEMKKEKDLA